MNAFNVFFPLKIFQGWPFGLLIQREILTLPQEIPSYGGYEGKGQSSDGALGRFSGQSGTSIVFSYFKLTVNY